MNSKEALDILNFAWSGRLDDKNYPDFDDINMALYTLNQNLLLFETREIIINKNSKLLEENLNLREENKKLKDELMMIYNSLCY